MSSHTFIRHGEHQEDPLFCGLSSLGCKEMRELDIDRSTEHIGVAPNKPRFIGSVALALQPEITDEQLDEHAAIMIRNERIAIDNSLDYKDPSANEHFMERMFDAYQAGRNLRFFVEESDGYTGDISTHSSMSGAVARVILHGHRLSQVVCAREFFIPSFRSRISYLMGGNRLQNEYVEWYEATQELRPEARRELVIVENEGEDYFLRDGFGETGFKKEHLIKVCMAQRQESISEI